MLFPIYVIDTGDGFSGRSPLVDMDFRGDSLAALFADVRATVSLIEFDAEKRRCTPEELMTACDGFGPYSGGDWTILPVGLNVAEQREPRERRNVSFATRTAQRIEVAAKQAGVTFSGWISQAASEKLARGG